MKGLETTTVGSTTRSVPRWGQTAPDARRFPPPPSAHHLRNLLLSTSAVTASLLLLSSPAVAEPVAPSPTPYQRGLNLPYGLEGGRIRRCDSGAQPNCVSTSNGARPQLYLPPFTAKGANATEAMDALDKALRSMYDRDAVMLVEEKKVEAEENEKGGVYKRYAVPSALVKIDYVEVYINDELTVFYRSQGSGTKYVPLITQPIGDLDAQKKRMLRLFREELNWKLVGGNCSVLECYDF